MAEEKAIRLKDFVSESVKQIIEGVDDAQRYFANSERNQKAGRPVVNPHGFADSKGKDSLVTSGDRVVSMLQFDVALGSTRSSSGGFQIGVLLSGIGIGARARDTDSDSTSSRLKFSIPVLFPMQLNPEYYGEAPPSSA